MKKMTLEESLQSIAISLSNVTEMGQYINVSSDAPETDLSGVEEKLEQLCGDVNYTLGEIRDEISSLNTNNTLELILMQLSRIADSLENKNK